VGSGPRGITRCDLPLVFLPNQAERTLSTGEQALGETYLEKLAHALVPFFRLAPGLIAFLDINSSKESCQDTAIIGFGEVSESLKDGLIRKDHCLKKHPSTIIRTAMGHGEKDGRNTDSIIAVRVPSNGTASALRFHPGTPRLNIKLRNRLAMLV